MTFVFTILILLIFGAIYLFFWNNYIYKVRIELLGLVSDASKVDIQRGLDWEWRYDALNEVSYNAMVLQPWRPPLSHYKNLDFADPFITSEERA